MKVIFILWLITANHSTPVGMYATEGGCWDAQTIVDYDGKHQLVCVPTDKLLFLEVSK